MATVNKYGISTVTSLNRMLEKEEKINELLGENKLDSKEND